VTWGYVENRDKSSLFDRAQPVSSGAGRTESPPGFPWEHGIEVIGKLAAM